MKKILNWIINIIFLAVELIALMSCVFVIYLCFALFSVATLFNVAWIPILGIIGFAASFSCNLISTYVIMERRLDDENKE